MDTIIRAFKPISPVVTGVPLAYIVITALVRFGFSVGPQIVLYVVGGVIGVFILGAAEEFFGLKPSPFRTVVFSFGLALVSVFLITSSSNMMAAGLVLSLYFTLILLQIEDLRKNDSLASWYRLVAQPVLPKTQILLFGFYTLVFAILTIVFVL